MCLERSLISHVVRLFSLKISNIMGPAFSFVKINGLTLLSRLTTAHYLQMYSSIPY